MNILPREKQFEAIAALCEGVSIRATERLTGVNRGTILSLGVRVGDGCATLHDAMMRGLHVSRIELDEAWSFVAKKQMPRGDVQAAHTARTRVPKRSTRAEQLIMISSSVRDHCLRTFLTRALMG
jgi:hypothetical protein